MFELYEEDGLKEAKEDADAKDDSSVENGEKKNRDGLDKDEFKKMIKRCA